MGHPTLFKNRQGFESKVLVRAIIYQATNHFATKFLPTIAVSLILNHGIKIS